MPTGWGGSLWLKTYYCSAKFDGCDLWLIMEFRIQNHCHRFGCRNKDKSEAILQVHRWKLMMAQLGENLGGDHKLPIEFHFHAPVWQQIGCSYHQRWKLPLVVYQWIIHSNPSGYHCWLGIVKNFKRYPLEKKMMRESIYWIVCNCCEWNNNSFLM